MDADEFRRYERKWTVIGFVSGLTFALALLDLMKRSPVGAEAVLCYILVVVGLIMCIVARNRLRDIDSLDGAMDGFDFIDDALPAILDSDD